MDYKSIIFSNPLPNLGQYRIYLFSALFILFNSVILFSQSTDTCTSLRRTIIERYGSRNDYHSNENIAAFKDFIVQAKNIGCDSEMGTIYRALGNIYKNVGLFSDADTSYQAALYVDSLIQDTLGVSKTYSGMTALELHRGNPYSGVTFADTGLTLLNKSSYALHTPTKHSLFINKANCLRELNRFEDALQLYDQVVADSTSRYWMIAFQAIGDIAFDQSRFGEAHNIYTGLYSYYDNDLSKQSNLDHKLGLVSRAQGDTTQAIVYFLNSRRKAIICGAKIIHFYALLDLLRLPPSLMDMDSTNLYKAELLELADSGIGDTYDQTEMILEMSADYLENGNNMEALYLFEDYGSQAGDFGFLYLYKQAKEKAKLDRSIMRRTFMGLSGGAISILIISFLFYANKRKQEKLEIERKQRQLADDLLQEEKRARKLENEKLEAERKRRKLADDLLEKERRAKRLEEEKRILQLEHAEELLKSAYDVRQKLALRTHDLKGVASGVRNGLNAFVDHFSHQPPKLENLQKVFNHSVALYDRLRDVSKEMFPSSTGWYSDLTTMLHDLENDTAITTTISETNIINNSFDAFIGYRILTILRVLIDNVKEHSHATEVNLKLEKKPQGLIIDFYDNGIGFDPKKVEGVGLQTVKIKVEEELGGKIKIITPPGARFIIEIPLIEIHE